MRPFVREANSTDKITTHRHDLHPKKKSSTTIVKMPPRRQNERSLQEMEEMRRQIQQLQEIVNAQNPFWKHNKGDSKMMSPVGTLHHLEAVAHNDANFR